MKNIIGIGAAAACVMLSTPAHSEVVPDAVPYRILINSSVEVVDFVEPDYPRGARVHMREGACSAEFIVSGNGKARLLDTVECSSARFHREARWFIRDAQFAVSQETGPDQIHTLTIEWRLEETD